MNKKIVIKYVCVLFAVLVVMYGIKGKFIGEVKENYNDLNAKNQVVSIAGNKIEQELTIRKSILSMDFYMKNNGNGTETVLLELWNPEQTQCYLKEDIAVPRSGNQEVILKWNTERADLQGATEIVLIINGLESADTISVCVQEDTEGQSYKYNGNEENWHVRMSVIYEYVRCWGFLFIFGAVLLIIGISCVYAWEKKLSIEKLFAVIAVSAGIGIALISPLGQEPDGLAHFYRTLDVSYGNILAPFENVAHEDGYNIRPENIDAINYEIIDPDAGEGFGYLKNLLSTKFSKNTILAEGENAYTSLYYMPQALGTLMGRVLNLNIYACMVLGRIVNLLCYAILTYWALKLMPIYKNLLAIIAMLPITIYQAASYSPDALLNGLCFLFVALCFYYAFGEKEKLSWKNVIVLGIMLVIILMCKYVYVCLGLLVFLIPMKKFGSKKEYWKSFGIAVLPVVVALIFCAVLFVINLTAAETGIAATEGGDIVAGIEDVAMTQFDYIKQNPFDLIKILFFTIKEKAKDYLTGLNMLGSLNYPLEPLQIMIPMFMVGIACLDTEGVQQKVKARHRIIFLAASIITIVAGMIGLYLMDANENPVGAKVINGYQIRYAIPCMVLLLSMFGSGKVINKINGFSVKVVGCMGLFLAVTIFMLVRICY